MTSTRAVMRHQGGRPGGPVLLALPPAGMGASSYAPLAAHLPDVQVWALQAPAREDRLAEEPARSVQALADSFLDAVLPDLASEVALYGHSLGAIVAYELAIRLEERGITPAFLMVGGARSPRDYSAMSGTLGVDLSDTALLEYSTALGGHWDKLVDPELAELMLGVLRRDLKLGFGYRLAAETVLDCPVVGCAGVDDPAVNTRAMAGWANFTRSTFSSRELPGGHLFFTESAPEFARAVTEAWGMVRHA